MKKSWMCQISVEPRQSDAESRVFSLELCLVNIIQRSPGNTGRHLCFEGV